MATKAAQARSRRFYLARKTAGLCTTCGLGRDREDRTRCEVCRRRGTEAAKLVWAARVSAGRCVRCGLPNDNAAQVCAHCLPQKRSIAAASARRRYYADIEVTRQKRRMIQTPEYCHRVYERRRARNPKFMQEHRWSKRRRAAMKDGLRVDVANALFRWHSFRVTKRRDFSPLVVLLRELEAGRE